MNLQFVSSVWSVREQKAWRVVGLMICFEVKTIFKKRIEPSWSWKWSETRTVYQPTESSERISSFFRTEKQTNDNPWKKQQLHSTPFSRKLITVIYCGYTALLLCSWSCCWSARNIHLFILSGFTSVRESEMFHSFTLCTSLLFSSKRLHCWRALFTSVTSV